MRVLLRVLAPLLSLAVAAIGVVVVIEVVAAWVSPSSDGLLVPWTGWRDALGSTLWSADPVFWIAIGVGVVGLILLLVGLLARRHDITLQSPSDGITVTTAPRVLARLVGRRVRAADNVSGATVTASGRKVSVRAEGRIGHTDIRSEVRSRVDEVLGELPLTRTPRVSVSTTTGSKGPQ